MPPPTSTDDKQGTVIDGNARSAEWRKKQRAAQRPRHTDSPEATTGVPADFDPAAAKDFVSSLMIPANKLAGETRENPPAPEASDAYIDKLLDGSREVQPRQELEDEARGSSAESDELDRWFEEQATSIPNAPAGQALPRGSASLDIETTAGVGAERTRRGRARRLRIARARENRQQRRQPAGRRPLHVRAHVTGLRVLVGTMLTVLPVAVFAIAAGGSRAHRSPISPATASTPTAFPGLVDTFISNAGRLPRIDGLGVRSRQHRPISHRTRRAPRRRPITHPRRSTGAAVSSTYTPRLASQAGSSPAPAASAPSSTSSASGSSPPPSSAPQPRTGPSGPISLIGAGTTPSG